MRLFSRPRVAGIAAAGIVAGGPVLGTVVDLAAAIPASVSVAALVGLLIAGPRGHRLVAWTGIVAGAVSLATTARYEIGQDDPEAAVVGLIEVGALLWLVVLVVRHAPFRLAVLAGGLLGLAEGMFVLRTINNTPVLQTVAVIGFFGLPSIAAAVGGAYLRSLDTKRVRAVDEARRTQRLDLARDLHDFVAHDVSGIVVQAQAAQVIAERNPEEVLAALRRIEAAGLQALASMDRTVHMLRETGENDGGREPSRGIAELPALVARFSESGTAEAAIDARLDPDDVPREIDTTAYRIVVEALTNVRRHAPKASRVDVTIARTVIEDKPTLTVRVWNDVPGHAGHAVPAGPSLAFDGPDRRGGLGLVGLAERVAALGGNLVAGPDDAGGWRVCVQLPLETS